VTQKSVRRRRSVAAVNGAAIQNATDAISAAVAPALPFTDFMLANEKSLEHSHFIIGELMKAVLDEVHLPLTLAKLEGDAIFLYAVKDDSSAERAEDLGARVLRFFHVFSNKVGQSDAVELLQVRGDLRRHRCHPHVM